MRGEAPEIRAIVDESLARMINSGEMAEIVEAYGIPWMPAIPE